MKEEIDMDNAYMLFYECRSMSYVQYIPDTSGKHPDMTTIEDEIEADYRKFCVIQWLVGRGKLGGVLGTGLFWLWTAAREGMRAVGTIKKN